MKEYTFVVRIEKEVTVKLNEDMFTPEFMESYNKSFHDEESIDTHAAFIARMMARYDDKRFIEGYYDDQFEATVEEIECEAEIDSDLFSTCDQCDMITKKSELIKNGDLCDKCKKEADHGNI